jgi:heme/copper-type cytochrome/quinol oxidase subunit 4
MAETNRSGNTIAKYLPVYFTLLIISVLEVLFAYQHFSTGALLAILLALAFCGGTLALRYFMHLAQETRGLFLTLIPAVIFVLLMLNMIWSDSFRLLRMRPFAH